MVKNNNRIKTFILNLFASKKTYYFLGAVFVIPLVMYFINLTRSGLWYDESIEYYYSKFLDGVVLEQNHLTNMYERICNTYQPPLYNVLMYLWLLVCDSEAWFRFAGVLTTFVGSIGLHKAVKSVTNDKYAVITTLAYLLNTAVSYYALECAEYNLMLANLCWATYFFVAELKQHTLKTTICFFAFAVLAVYSQYGAAFIILGMYFVMLINVILGKNKRHAIDVGAVTIITGVVAVIPLIAFFLIPQITKQGTLDVSHSLYFAAGNIIVDLVKSAAMLFVSIFLSKITAKSYILLLSPAIIGTFAVMAFLSIFKKKNRVFLGLFFSLIVSFICYYSLVATSYYGYNSWAPSSIGTMNIGGRYSLFFIPVLIVTLSCGVFHFMSYIKEKSIKQSKIYNIILLCMLFVFLIIESIPLVYGWTKNDVRELTDVWYDKNNYQETTIVHDWCYSNFQFYLTHDKRYEVSLQDTIETSPIRPSDIEQMESIITIKPGEAFYFVCPSGIAHELFLELMDSYSYEVSTLYSEGSVLLHACPTP